MNTAHLLAFFKAHPVSYKVHGYALLFFLVAAFLLGSLVFNNVLATTAIDIISENLAPKTFHVTCTVALIFLSGYVALRGPFQSLDGRGTRLFGVYFSNMALALGAAYVGIAWGVFLAAVAFQVSLPQSYSFQTLFWICVQFLVALVLLFIFFVLLTVNGSVAPGYRSPKYVRNVRVLSGIFLFGMCGRTVLLIYMALTGAK